MNVRLKIPHDVYTAFAEKWREWNYQKGDKASEDGSGYGSPESMNFFNEDIRIYDVEYLEGKFDISLGIDEWQYFIIIWDMDSFMKLQDWIKKYAKEYWKKPEYEIMLIDVPKNLLDGIYTYEPI